MHDALARVHLSRNMTTLNVCPSSSPPHSRVVSRKVMPMISAVGIFTDKGGSTNAQANGTGTSDATTDSTATVHPPANAHSEHTDKDNSINQSKRLSFQAAAGAIRFGANIFKGPWNSSSKTVMADESTHAGLAVAKDRFNPSKALQKAAHKLTVTRAFQVNVSRLTCYVSGTPLAQRELCALDQLLTCHRCLGISRST